LSATAVAEGTLRIVDESLGTSSKCGSGNLHVKGLSLPPDAHHAQAGELAKKSSVSTAASRAPSGTPARRVGRPATI